MADQHTLIIRGLSREEASQLRDIAWRERTSVAAYLRTVIRVELDRKQAQEASLRRPYRGAPPRQNDHADSHPVAAKPRHAKR